MQTVMYKDEKLNVSKVICIGRNYVEHIEELGNEIPSEMVVFNKPNSAITDELHYFSDTCRFEGEICFLIQNKQIAGIGFGLDLTHADIQNKLKSKGLPWERAKAFDKSAVFSTFIPYDGDIRTLEMRLTVNEHLVQFADYSLMMYKPKVMISEIHRFMSLEENDIIMSGTPKGVATYKAGDRFVGQIFSDERLILEHSWIVQ
jgi:2-keto-4-pentenoate hydratase/2-oxohepta-3-ene-1,7-dioic acid hydratase in catechol pathway